VHFEENKIRIRMNETTGEIKDVIVDGAGRTRPTTQTLTLVAGSWSR
jgi:hypothetical protein